MAQLNSAIGGKFATYGYYAQAQNGQTFTGGQLLAVKDDVVKSGAIFEAAVSGTGILLRSGKRTREVSMVRTDIMCAEVMGGCEFMLEFVVHSRPPHECDLIVAKQ